VGKPRWLICAERHTRPAPLDHDPVVVRMALERDASPGRHVEVAHPIAGGAVGRPDQIVLLDSGQRRVVIGAPAGASWVGRRAAP
jgi:hypothetical protein